MTAAVLLAAALAASGPRPDWIDGMPAAFPRERFVAAAGDADERAVAEARARAGISAFFESRVTAAMRVEEAEARVAAGGLELRAASLSTSQEVAAATAKLLEGVEIADAWTDPATGRIHALAVLDRARAVEVLRRRIGEVDAEVAALHGRRSAEAERVERARLAYRLVSTAGRRRPLVHELRILDPAAEPAPPVDVASMGEEARKALSELSVSVRASGDAAGAVGAAVARAVVATGLRAVKPPARRDLDAAVAVEAAAPALDGRWTLVRLTARVRVDREPAGDAFIAFVESAKGASGDAEEARTRAQQALAAAVEERLAVELRARFEAP